MTHDVIKHLLDDYVTGELTSEARAPVADHIAGCEICRAEVESLERVIARTAELPRSIEPPAEAWSNIRAAMERDAKALAPGGSPLDLWRQPYMLAAAALLVAVLSSGGTFLYLSYDPEKSVAGTQSAGSGETPASLAAFTMEENTYLRNARILQDLLEQQQDVLAPETVAQLKASLSTIDEAILESRNALARDPANKMLVEMLSSSYRQKLDLLRRTTEMTRGS